MVPEGKQQDLEIERPLYGKGRRVFGAMIGSLSVEGPEQALLLAEILDDGRRKYAGRHEETYLVAARDRVDDMLRKAEEEGWKGWEHARRQLPDG